MKNEKQIASVPTVWYNAQDLKSSNEAGYYMLKDNRRSRDSVYDYEKGIVINDDIYLTLNYPKHELTKSEAQAFCRIKGGRIPDSFELWQIQMVRDEIERSLARITYPQRELPADIMSCWCADRSDSELSETRRPLLLIDGKRHNPDDSVQKHGGFGYSQQTVCVCLGKRKICSQKPGALGWVGKKQLVCAEGRPVGSLFVYAGSRRKAGFKGML